MGPEEASCIRKEKIGKTIRAFGEYWGMRKCEKNWNIKKAFYKDMDKYETYTFTGPEPKIIIFILSTPMFSTYRKAIVNELLWSW